MGDPVTTQDPTRPTTPPPPDRPLWQSKTAWVGLATALIPLIPGVGPAVTAFIQANPQAVAAGLGVLFTGIRLISHGKVTIK